jgi:two-component system, NarL family, sensor kinase
MGLSIKEVLITNILGGLLLVFLTLVIFVSAIRYQKRQRKHILEKQQLQSQFTQTLLQSQLEIQEQTLQQVSRELHDNLGQIASLIKINLNTLQLSDLAKATEKVEATKGLIRQLLADLKALSVSLGSDRLNQLGLVKALQAEVDNLNKTDAFTAAFVSEGVIPEIDDDKAIILYRMAQEVLNNMVKHSKAPLIKLSVSFKENIFTLAFTDNGTGFDIAAKLQSGGAGLKNLQNRAQLINAILNIDSQPGQGTHISIQIAL